MINQFNYLLFTGLFLYTLSTYVFFFFFGLWWVGFFFEFLGDVLAQLVVGFDGLPDEHFGIEASQPIDFFSFLIEEEEGWE